MTRRLLHFDMVDDQMAEVFRAKSEAERVEMMAAANRTARLLAAAGIRCLHPDWSDEQVQSEVARRMLRGADGTLTKDDRGS